MDAYREICAYTCFRIHRVTGAATVDHMVPRSCAWDRVYEWSDYRLACQLVNACKREFSDVLDPFEIEDGWFVLEMVGFQVKPAEGLSDEIRKQVEDTISRLGLNESSVRNRREADAEAYWHSSVQFEFLLEQSPFVARELQRQGRLRPEDTRALPALCRSDTQPEQARPEGEQVAEGSAPPLANRDSEETAEGEPQHGA